MTSHFKHADKVLRDRIVRFLDPFLPTPRYRIEHACLVGFSWEGYRELRSVTGRDAAIQRFVRQYASEAPRLRQMFSDTLGGFASRFHLEVFFLPFECVAQFRREFAEALA